MITTNAVIDPDAVEKTFKDSLYKTEEVTDGETPEGAVIVSGIIVDAGFNPVRLNTHREQVREWLKLLPHEFRKGGAGGWTFLNACNQADGQQWTGLHQRMEQLFMLGIGLGMAKWLGPRELWAVMPGGMPYVEVDVDA